jgi:glycosyltransferase involved in cell wall biosynthesis
MKNQQPLISIIVPVYNVEEYLKDCVDSLLNQDISTEIILINDGSTDSSEDIADRYQQQYGQIIVLHQKNQGLSIARNNGLKYATGEYVVFIDSDDWIEKDSLKALYEKAKASEVDMAMGGIRFCYPDGKWFEPFGNILKEYQNKVFTGKNWFAAIFVSGIYYLMVCNYVYRRKWLIAYIIHKEENICCNILYYSRLLLYLIITKNRTIRFSL